MAVSVKLPVFVIVTACAVVPATTPLWGSVHWSTPVDVTTAVPVVAVLLFAPSAG